MAFGVSAVVLDCCVRELVCWIYARHLKSLENFITRLYDTITGDPSSKNGLLVEKSFGEEENHSPPKSSTIWDRCQAPNDISFWRSRSSS
ncbi:hypothetical protein CEXT_503331 [Caerostris extrusa]|uniref:Uncharacterized protein n=1 Tax=Caerostris extrusa TaxID=172846 RepID=A0AAV4NYI0_CAEEX|nr:hypothetical protein CEXT_503331 [Caerostris extrusa]